MAEDKNPYDQFEDDNSDLFSPSTHATVEEMRNILKYISKGYKVPDIIINTLKEVAHREIEEKDKVVVIKRDPDFHYGRIQGMYVRIIDGNTIEVHPAVIGPFGADFDGDTMSVFVPLSEEAQIEVKDKMVTGKSKYGINKPQYSITMESVAGLFMLTSEINKGPHKRVGVDDVDDMHPGDPVQVLFRGKTHKTTAGRVVFNKHLPSYIPFVDEEVDKKKVAKILEQILHKSESDHMKAIDSLIKLGFKIGTIYPQTFSIGMFQMPPHINKLKKQLEQEKDVLKQMDITNKMESELLEHFKKNNKDMYQLVKSGASKGTNQIRQIMVAKGLISDAQGNILPPISKSTAEGLSPEEYFEASAGARKGITDRAINTADGGYAYRKIIYILSDVEANINNADCGTKRTMDIILTKDLFSRMEGRYVITDAGKIAPINPSMVSSRIKLRTPIFCKTKQICRTCYGDLIKSIRSKNVGMIAAAEVGSLGEKIMKCQVGVVEKEDGKLYSMEDLWNMAD